MVGLSSHYARAASNAKLLSQGLDAPLGFTGHSLGGGLAALAALVTGKNAITFNAASLSSGTINSFSVSGKSQAGILAVSMRFDPLTILQDLTPWLNSAQGIRAYIQTPYLHNPLQYHSIDTFFEAFNR